MTRSSRLATDSSESPIQLTCIKESLGRKERVTTGRSSPSSIASTPPGFVQSGQILTHATASSKLLRRWQECCWVYLRPALLLIFRSRKDFEKWAMAVGGDMAGRRKDRSILLVVDFDTLGILASHGNGYERGINPNSLLSNTKGSSAKLISKLHKYALGDVNTTLSGTVPL